jgi:hypothetical protein
VRQVEAGVQHLEPRRLTKPAVMLAHPLDPRCARSLPRRTGPEDIRARGIWNCAGSSIEAQYDYFPMPAPGAFEDELFLAGRLRLDKREPHPGFALWAASMQQRIEPLTQLGMLHNTSPLYFYLPRPAVSFPHS